MAYYISSLFLWLFDDFDELVPDSGRILLSIRLSARRTVKPRRLRNFARERRRELLKSEQKESRADAKSNAGAASGVRITEKLHASQFYRRQRRGRRKREEVPGENLHRKIWPRFPLSPSPSLTSLLMRSQARCPE